MSYRKPLGCLAVACLLLLAGCTSGLSLSEAESQSDVVETVDLSIDRENTATLTVTYESSPTIEEEYCWFNPATKVTQCDYDDYDVNITQSRLLLSTDANTTDDDRVLEPVERTGQTVVFEYETGEETEVTVESTVVGIDDGKEWGTVPFGFEADPASRNYIVSNSTWYDEEF